MWSWTTLKEKAKNAKLAEKGRKVYPTPCVRPLGMVKRAAHKVPLLLECGHTILVNEAELDWNAKYYRGICGHDSIIDLRRRPIRKLEQRKLKTVIDALRSLIGIRG